MCAPRRFELSTHREGLSQPGAPLVALARHMDCEVLCAALGEVRGDSARLKGGRSPDAPGPRFKVLVRASVPNLRAEGMALLSRARLSGRRWRGVPMGAPPPTQKTSGRWRENRPRAGAFQALSVAFAERLRGRGDPPPGGQLVAAPLGYAPRPRRPRQEPARAKAGERTPERWPAPAANASQNDTKAHGTGKSSMARKPTVGQKPGGAPPPRPVWLLLQGPISARRPPCPSPAHGA